MDEMRQAIEDLKAAENRFDNAITVKEIDMATYEVKAAQLRIDIIRDSYRQVG